MSSESGEENNKSEKLTYKGSVSGLKGFLSNRISKIAEVVVAGAEALENAGGSKQIPISLIFPNPNQPRQVFDPKALEELSTTMKEVGQAQAITVRPQGTGYEIISGERRYRAARLAGITHLECVVKEVSDNEAQLLSLVENLQRQDLLPIEEAHYLKKVLKENRGLSLDKLAKMLSSHKSTLSEKIQLTEVPEDEQKLLYAKGKSFTHRHWRVLSRIKDSEFLKKLLKQTLEEQLSVSELEKVLEAAGVPKAKRMSSQEKQQDSKEWKSPVQCEGDTFVLKSGTYYFSSLSLEKKKKLKEELLKVVERLEAPEQVLKSSESTAPETNHASEISL
jgi:ParB family chromosome partitioning protein